MPGTDFFPVARAILDPKATVQDVYEVAGLPETPQEAVRRMLRESVDLEIEPARLRERQANDD